GRAARRDRARAGPGVLERSGPRSHDRIADALQHELVIRGGFALEELHRRAALAADRLEELVTALVADLRPAAAAGLGRAHAAVLLSVRVRHGFSLLWSR